MTDYDGRKKPTFIGEDGGVFCRSCGAFNEPPDKILRVRRAQKSIAGSCMTCTRSHRMVNVISSPTNLEIRLCDKCVKEIRTAKV